MTRRFNRLAYALIIALTLATVYLFFDSVTDQLAEAEARADRRDAAIVQNQRALKDANAKVTALANQIEAEGEKPVVSASPVVVTGERGPGPTLGQVIVAVQAYCEAHGQCIGRTGRGGIPGDDGTDGIDGLDGRDGIDGTNGTDGKDGEKGDPGETCPDGTSLQETTYMTSMTESQTGYICR